MQDDSTSRLASSLETINARIARLAIGLGISLDTAQAVQELLELPPAPPVAVERRVAGSAAPAGMQRPVERRIAHLKEELRALVVLRYRLESASVENNGLAATRDLLNQAHRHLLEQGFKPGSDGWDEREWQPRN